jgi:hypothetical protein
MYSASRSLIGAWGAMPKKAAGALGGVRLEAALT